MKRFFLILFGAPLIFAGCATKQGETSKPKVDPSSFATSFEKQVEEKILSLQAKPEKITINNVNASEDGSQVEVDFMTVYIDGTKGDSPALITYEAVATYVYKGSKWHLQKSDAKDYSIVFLEPVVIEAKAFKAK